MPFEAQNLHFFSILCRTWASWKALATEPYAPGSFAGPSVGWAAGPRPGLLVKFAGNLPTGVVNFVQAPPEGFRLFQNYPNPFNPSTKIQFTLAERTNVALKVFDVLGREVATLVDQTLAPGTHDVVFEANDLSTGVYFYRLQAGEFVQTRKLTVMR